MTDIARSSIQRPLPIFALWGADDGDAFLREIVGIFLADTPLRLDANSMRASPPATPTAFTRAAHSIKGSSANLGALALQSAANRLEARSRENAPGLESGVADLKARVRSAQRPRWAASWKARRAVPPAALQR